MSVAIFPIFRAHQVLAYSVIGCSILFLFYIVLTGGDTRTSEYGIYNSDDSVQCPNSTYPGYKVTSRTGTNYRIAVIADLDTDSKVDDCLKTFLNLNGHSLFLLKT